MPQPLILLTGASSISVATQTGADENVAAALKTQAISAALEHVGLHRDSTTAFLAHIAAIVSPSGQEHERAEGGRCADARYRPNLSAR